MLDNTEKARLERLYEQLREKLLDLTKKNRMLNYPLGSRSRRQLHLVDEVIEQVYAKLVDQEIPLRIAPLPEPDSIPPDERTDDFVSTLEHARVSDVEYLVAMEALQAAGGDNEVEAERLERALRDRVRITLGLPPRPNRKEINRNDHARSIGIDPNPELSPRPGKSSHSDGALQTLKYPDELESLLDKFREDARLAEQEAGISTLFLALGFLEWYENDASDKPMYAPLLLLPVRIEVRSVRGKPEYAVVPRDLRAEENVSLQKFMEKTFGRAIPAFQGAEDDEVGSVEAYFGQVRSAVEGLKRWQVRRWLVLGHFSFSRIAIYEDTKPERWATAPVETPLVHALLSGFDREAEDGSPILAPDDYPIDDPEIESKAPILVQDADASQHSALIDVMSERNLVIEGPPGTGKSQTITNIIANALAAEKTVLFLAEKQAALDVVKRRLDDAKLGEFCLELHSDRASAKSAVASLQARFKLGVGFAGRRTPSPFDATWDNARRAISDYVGALHEAQDDDATPFSLMWSAIRGAAAHADLASEIGPSTMPDRLVEEPLAIREARGRIELYARQTGAFARAFGHPAGSPWARFPPRALQHQEQDQLLAAIERLRETGRALAAVHGRLAELGIVGPGALDLARRRLEMLPEPASDIDPEPWLAVGPEAALEALRRRSEILTGEAEFEAARSSLGNAVRSAGLALAVLGLMPSEVDPDTIPAELFAIADRKITDSEARERLLTAMVDVAGAFGFDARLPSRALPALASAVVMLATITPPNAEWFVRDDIDDDAVERLFADWKVVQGEDASLQALAPGLARAEDWNAAALRIAAARRRKSGLGRLLGRIKGEARETEALLAGLGIPNGDGGAADLLDRVADHVGRVQALAASPTGTQIFGPSWSWRTSPIEAALAGRKLRHYVRTKLVPIEAGEDIARVIGRLSLAEIRTISEFKADAARFRAAEADIAYLLDHRDVPTVVAGLVAERTRWQTLLAADPERSLAAHPIPLRVLAHAERLRGRISAAREALDATGLADRIVALTPDMSAIEAADRALAWIRAVREARLPDAAERELLSQNPAAARERYRRILSDTPFAEHQAALATLRGFGLEGLAELDLADLVGHADALLDRRAELRDFVALSDLRREMVRAGLGDFLNRADRVRLAPERLVGAFDWVLARRRAERAKAKAAPLANGNGPGLDARRQVFAERDREKIQADRALVRARLLARMPPAGVKGGSVKTWTEMALLQNEFSKQKRHTPVRALLGRAGQSVMTLKPCFMMSPLSLAKFLPPGQLAFDILVIDEASQMRPEDALGAMLRARQIVVVGDPKQLPPTSFFDRADATPSDDDDAADDIDDESILERCLKVFGQIRRLKWHYRSKCESLIRFSNEEFYGDLITFPSARPGSFSVDLIRVDGAYQARRNADEANRISEEAVAFMRHHAEMDKAGMPSLGIITLNTDQRDLVQDTLRRLSADDPLVERYREAMEQRGEPLIVKNLENIQGDERDYIFISMTYGKEPGLKVLKQRFGPINNRQGHRRLNVLFSRARRRIGLFASFGSVDVVPSETSRDGVHVMKRYLEYAETRGRARHASVGDTPDSDFEMEVARRLEARGYRVDLQIGVSGYRIDLGVRDPDQPDGFLAGIECDGAAYHSSRSARDRDRLREEVLRGLGWEILRVWSTDWFEAAELQTERLVRELEALRGSPARLAPDYPLWRPAPAAIQPDAAVFEAGSFEAEAPPGPAATAEEAAPSEPIETRNAAAEIDGTRPLSEAEAFDVLAAFRETVIRPAADPWEPQRSILRDGMIETLVRQRVSDPEEWFAKIPHYQRTATNPVEKRLYLERICAVVARI